MKSLNKQITSLKEKVIPITPDCGIGIDRMAISSKSVRYIDCASLQEQSLNTFNISYYFSYNTNFFGSNDFRRIHFII